MEVQTMACSTRRTSSVWIRSCAHHALLGLATLLSAPRATAQFEQEWLTPFSARGTKSFFVLGQDIASDGRLWVAAMTTRTDALDPLSIYGPKSLLLLRFDPDGKIEWLLNQPQPPLDSDTNVHGAVKVDAEGCAYVASRIGQAHSLTKYSPVGVELWRRPLDLYWGDLHYAPMALDDEGRIVVAGIIPVSGSPGEQDLRLIQFDSAGELRWLTTHPGIGQGLSMSRHVEVDAAGRIHLTALSALHPVGLENGVLSLAFDGDGRLLWSSKFHPGPGVSVFPMQVEVTGDGIRTIAVRVGSMNGNTWVTDAFVLLRLGAAGESLWTNTETVFPHYDKICTGMATSPSGELIVSGLTLDFVHPTASLLTRAFVGAYSAQGKPLWGGGSTANCTMTAFHGPPLFDALGRVVLISTESCNPIDLTLEMFSMQGQPLGSERVALPGGGGVVQASGIVDGADTIRVVGKAGLQAYWDGGMLFAARYTLE